MTRPSGESRPPSASSGKVSPIQALPVTSNGAVSRFETVSSGQNTRKFVGLSRTMSRSRLPRSLVGSASPPPGCFTSTA